MDGVRAEYRWRERSSERDERTHGYHRTEPRRWASPHPDNRRQAEVSRRLTYADALKRGLREKSYDRQNKRYRDHDNYRNYLNESEHYSSYNDYERDDDEWVMVRAGPRRRSCGLQTWRPHLRQREDDGRWREGRNPQRIHGGDDRRHGRQNGQRRTWTRGSDLHEAPNGERRHGRADERRPAADERQRGAAAGHRGPDRHIRPVSNGRRPETQTTDPNFIRQVRVINKLIKALHHLKNVEDVNAPPTNINRMTDTLTGFIKPSSPTEKTLNLIENNAKTWCNTSIKILQQHYSDVIDEQAEVFLNVAGEDWSAPFEVAVKWARRSLGRKLSTDTTDHIEALLIAKTAQTRQTEQIDTSETTIRSQSIPKPRKRGTKTTSGDNQTDIRETRGPTPPPPLPTPPPRARQTAAPPVPPEDVEPAPSDPAMTTRVQTRPPLSTNVATNTADANPARQGCNHVRSAAWVHAAPRQSEVLSPTASRVSVMSGDEQSEWEREGEGETSEGETSEEKTPPTSDTTSQQDSPHTLGDTPSSGVASDTWDDITPTRPPQKKSTTGPPLTKLTFTWEDLQEWTTPAPPRMTRSTLKKLKKLKECV